LLDDFENTCLALHECYGENLFAQIDTVTPRYLSKRIVVREVRVAVGE